MTSAVYDCPAVKKMRALEAANVVESVHSSRAIKLTEVRSAHVDSELGYFFPDRSCNKSGLSYCMNSASLRLIHCDRLESERHGECGKRFAKQEA